MPNKTKLTDGFETDQAKEKYASKKEALEQELSKKWKQNIDKVAALRIGIKELEEKNPELLEPEKSIENEEDVTEPEIMEGEVKQP